MKQHIENLVHIALRRLQEAGELMAIPAYIQVGEAKDNNHGDFSTNIALILAKSANKNPFQLAERIVRFLPDSPHVQKVEIAGPGFINFFLSPQALNSVITAILTEKQAFGRSKMGRGKKVLVEFLSADPTGPLNISHGRLAVFGSVLANLLDAVGFNIYREYYINDVGAPDTSLQNVLRDIREDLSDFGIHFDSWFSERQLSPQIEAEGLYKRLQHHGHIYERDGVIWFRSTDFGDSKDRALTQANQRHTYFVHDVAYHLSKFDRGFDIALNIFDANYHDYIKRMKAAMEAASINPERLIQVLVQSVSLNSNTQADAPINTEGIMTLRALRREVGNDAARFFLLMRKSEHSIEFDLHLAKKQSNENPVYYLQYAHARICHVFAQLAARHIKYDEQQGLRALYRLVEPHERKLLNMLSRYPDAVFNAALYYEPYLLINYLRELAAAFHAYYNAYQFLVDDVELRNARLTLIAATRQILFNGFSLIGISAPENM